MLKYNKIEEQRKYSLGDTYFDNLMGERIRNVLLICSRYDAFALEEDGRIDEQIYNEYSSLNLRTMPAFKLVVTPEKAYQILRNESIDLVIIMMSMGKIDAFDIAKKVKTEHPDKPLVVLTHFSREVLKKIDRNKGYLNYIDYIFSWLGNADILMAIIKLIEDKLNAEHDINEVGVQAILLVEDSIRYYSSYLPNIYKIIFTQSKRFMAEGLNEHQKMLRMRGRPKIFLATNYDEAFEIFSKYRNNLLGVISDINYKRQDKCDPEAGLKFFRLVRENDPYMPFILQSSDVQFEKTANELGVGFINKYSKNLSIELRNYFIRYFDFGDFVFRDPDTMEEISRAGNLQQLQQKILEIPDKTLLYHIKQNHFSKWLYARAIFPIGQSFKSLTLEDFENLDKVREFIYETISNFRMTKSRGVIAKFDKISFDEFVQFSRIGDGSIGGKARGLAYIDSFLKKNDLFNKYPDITITIPRTVVLCTDIFDEFMETHNLYKVGLSDLSDEEILQKFVAARLPSRVFNDLYTFISVIKNPIAIRSSSLLEDSHYQPFAGIYSTYMIPRNESDPQQTIKHLTDAIKAVYASVFFKASKAYMSATHNVIDEEKMAIVLQEVCGAKYGSRFYPTFSGVARSINFYPMEPEKPGEGIVNVAYGLGKTVVDGGTSLRFSPKYSRKILQLSSPDTAFRETQKLFYCLDMSNTEFVPDVDDSRNLLNLKIGEAENDHAFRYAVSSYDIQNNIIRDGISYPGKKIITFSNILRHNTFPLSDILQELLKIGETEMNNPIEMEFAANLDTPKGIPKLFNFLQIRPIVDTGETVDINWNEVKLADTLIQSNSALGNGVILEIRDLIYVKPEKFDSTHSPEIAVMIEKLNEKMKLDDKNYVLVGPGRWGSSDHWLGIPVKWAQISQARVIVESGLDKYRIDPSQGTHFFQNLTSFRVAYLTINPYMNDGYYNLEFINNQQAVFENDWLRHIIFEKPVKIIIDGKNNKGVIFKPGMV